MLARRLRRLSPFRVLVLGALAALGGAVGAAPATAAIPWAPCAAAKKGSHGPTTGYQCAGVPVPLDRTGAVPGSVNLSVARVPAASNPTQSAVIGLAGGPGQAALPLAQDFAENMAPAIATRDLLIFDQRGTGASGALDCAALHRRGSIVALAKSCATEIGAARAFYRTADSVADIEALRVAGGYQKLVLFGVSYGTKVAEDYAAAYPQNVEALVLDSVVLPEGADPLSRSTLATAPRVLQDLCAGTACRGATNDVKSDLSRLAAKLRKHALRGRVTLPNGSRERLTMGQLDLLTVLIAGDLNPTLRAELPGSMRAALRGDASPLLRLVVRSEGLAVGLQSTATNPDSDALYVTTLCEESPFPWTRTADAETREQEVTAAAKAIPKAQLGPFSPAAAVQFGAVPTCLGWPDASPAPAAPAALPPVRTLILDGQMDLRTPYEDAAQLAARIPGAFLIEVPYTGHSTTSSDMSDKSACTKGALATFFAGGAPTPCAAFDNPISPTRRPPTRLGQVQGRSVRTRTIVAAASTVRDAARQIIGDTIALEALPRHVAGLRGGNATITSARGAFRLNRYQYVPGVVVSGTVSSAGNATVSIRGGGALGGTLKITAAGRISGTLGGRKLAIAAAAAVGAPQLPSVSSSLARPARLGR